MRPKLTSLKPRVSSLKTTGPATLTTQTQRKRGWAGQVDRDRIRQRDCGMCQECKRQGFARAGRVVDHIIPLWAGGSDEDDNKQLLCDPCHDAKSKAEAAQRAGGG